MKPTAVILGLILAGSYAFTQEAAHSNLANLNSQISKNPANLSLYYERAELYDAMNDFVRSNKDYEKVLALYKKNPDKQYIDAYLRASYRLADDYFFRNSNEEKALSYVQAGIKEAPGSRDLEILEGIILAFVPEKQEEAGQKLQALSSKYPDDARLSYYYGKFLKKTDPIAAAAQFEKVLVQQPSDIEILVTLGTLYNNEASRLSELKTDLRTAYTYAAKAATYFKRAYTLNPYDKELAHIIKTLDAELEGEDNLIKQKQPF